MVRTSSSRGRPRGIAPLEAAIAFALIGSLLAVAVPAFLREIHASRLAAVAYGREHALAPSAPGMARAPVFPPSAPLNPSSPPRGRCEIDPPEAWDGPTWVALSFRPVPAGTPHCFAFAFDSSAAATGAPTPSTFRAHAHGDLDGDGIPSTFEITGRSIEGDPHGAVLDPGMFVDAETE
jgi:hypothetical protein